VAQWLLITSVILLASTLQSMTGFGFAVLAVPLLVPLLPPRHAVALIAVLSTATTVLAWWRIRAETAPGWIGRLFPAGLLGIPLGLVALVSLPADGLRVVVGLSSLAIAGVLLWSHTATAASGPVAGVPATHDQHRRRRWAIWLAGLASGVLAGGLGMPGPPIMVLLQYAGMPKHTYRATALGYFTLLYPVTLLVMVAQGVLSGQIVAESVTYLPAVLGGIVLGHTAHRRVPQRAFTRIVLLLLAAAGLLAGWTGLQGLYPG
jgi:uncharacterized membrane protein YfcA